MQRSKGYCRRPLATDGSGTANQQRCGWAPPVRMRQPMHHGDNRPCLTAAGIHDPGAIVSSCGAESSLRTCGGSTSREFRREEKLAKRRPLGFPIPGVIRSLGAIERTAAHDSHPRPTRLWPGHPGRPRPPSRLGPNYDVHDTLEAQRRGRIEEIEIATPCQRNPRRGGRYDDDEDRSPSPEIDTPGLLAFSSKIRNTPLPSRFRCPTNFSK